MKLPSTIYCSELVAFLDNIAGNLYSTFCSKFECNLATIVSTSTGFTFYWSSDDAEPSLAELTTISTDMATKKKKKKKKKKKSKESYSNDDGDEETALTTDRAIKELKKKSIHINSEINNIDILRINT